jgi:hypothetical protein
MFLHKPHKRGQPHTSGQDKQIVLCLTVKTVSQRAPYVYALTGPEAGYKARAPASDAKEDAQSVFPGLADGKGAGPDRVQLPGPGPEHHELSGGILPSRIFKIQTEKILFPVGEDFFYGQGNVFRLGHGSFLSFSQKKL